MLSEICSGTVLNVGIDGQIFALHEYGGISRYFSSLLATSDADPVKGVNLYPLFARHRNRYLKAQGLGYYCSSESPASLLSGRLHYDGHEQISQYALPDIIHATYYLGQPNMYLESRKTKLVSTLHDMIPENYPAFFPNGNPHHNKLEWFDKSDLIIAVSHSAASDLIDLKPNLASKIHVIHHCAAIQGGHDSTLKVKIAHDPYFLFVGTRTGYKNSRLILRAFRRAGNSLKRHKIIFAGGGPPSHQELQYIHDLGLAESIKFANPDDAQLMRLYAGADAVLVPSLAEGFSLPLVEALTADTPVICSDIAVHHEVGNGFVHFASPTNPEDWASLMATVHICCRPSEMLGNSLCKKIDYYGADRVLSQHLKAYLQLQ